MEKNMNVRADEFFNKLFEEDHSNTKCFDCDAPNP